jgi:putative two-component system response regulator
MSAKAFDSGEIISEVRREAALRKRPYKPAFDHPKTVDIFTRGDGHTLPEHFDPVILAAFKQNHQSFCDIFEAYSE